MSLNLLSRVCLVVLREQGDSLTCLASPSRTANAMHVVFDGEGELVED